jgi:hypothetical protein
MGRKVHRILTISESDIRSRETQKRDTFGHIWTHLGHVWTHFAPGDAKGTHLGRIWDAKNGCAFWAAPILAVRGRMNRSLRVLKSISLPHSCTPSEISWNSARDRGKDTLVVGRTPRFCPKNSLPRSCYHETHPAGNALDHLPGIAANRRCLCPRPSSHTRKPTPLPRVNGS